MWLICITYPSGPGPWPSLFPPERPLDSVPREKTFLLAPGLRLRPFGAVVVTYSWVEISGCFGRRRGLVCAANMLAILFSFVRSDIRSQSYKSMAWCSNSGINWKWLSRLVIALMTSTRCLSIILCRAKTISVRVWGFRCSCLRNMLFIASALLLVLAIYTKADARIRRHHTQVQTNAA